MTDPWMVQNSGQQNNSEENGAQEDGIQQQQQTLEKSEETPFEFEDNFSPVPLPRSRNNCENSVSSTKRNEKNSNTDPGFLEPLPDSDSYLRGLERKLQKIKKGANLVEALAEKRNDCLRQLLHSGDPDNNNAVLALDQPLNSTEFYRHLQPVQPISVGELVNIVKYDQLQHEEQEQESANKQETTEKEEPQERK